MKKLNQSNFKCLIKFNLVGLIIVLTMASTTLGVKYSCPGGCKTCKKIWIPKKEYNSGKGHPKKSGSSGSSSSSGSKRLLEEGEKHGEGEEGEESDVVCMTCKKTFSFNAKTNKCYQCLTEGCDECPTDKNVCTKCGREHFLAEKDG
jgi:hypothetical protein